MTLLAARLRLRGSIYLELNLETLTTFLKKKNGANYISIMFTQVPKEHVEECKIEV